uniref:Uncharacterized protein n=1 Tax=Grammatophora oceanica TaxID=210454 RepID=A0A7S1UY97_9STRA|mmetsp:Transcript_29599/g.43644  ORF Transcript_29599/g.43644 Transcript_29599/m.43644 type:complete len:410 (+) Transcript_29599:38-1267(+)
MRDDLDHVQQRSQQQSSQTVQSSPNHCERNQDSLVVRLPDEQHLKQMTTASDSPYQKPQQNPCVSGEKWFIPGVTGKARCLLSQPDAEKVYTKQISFRRSSVLASTSSSGHSALPVSSEGSQTTQMLHSECSEEDSGGHVSSQERSDDEDAASSSAWSDTTSLVPNNDLEVALNLYETVTSMSDAHVQEEKVWISKRRRSSRSSSKLDEGTTKKKKMSDLYAYHSLVDAPITLFSSLSLNMTESTAASTTTTRTKLTLPAPKLVVDPKRIAFRVRKHLRKPSVIRAVQRVKEDLDTFSSQVRQHLELKRELSRKGKEVEMLVDQFEKKKNHWVSKPQGHDYSFLTSCNGVQTSRTSVALSCNPSSIGNQVVTPVVKSIDDDQRDDCCSYYDIYPDIDSPRPKVEMATGA